MDEEVEKGYVLRQYPGVYLCDYCPAEVHTATSLWVIHLENGVETPICRACLDKKAYMKGGE